MPGAYGWAEWSVFDPTGRSHLFRYYVCLGFIEPDDVVIEASCGNGAGAELMARRAKKVIAYDIDEAQIDGCKGIKGDNIDWHVADLETAILEPCDVAITIETIEHLADAEHFVSELKRNTRRFIVFTIDNLPSVASGLPTWHKKDYSAKESEQLMVDDDWGLLGHQMLGGSYWGCIFNKKYFKDKYGVGQ